MYTYMYSTWSLVKSNMCTYWLIYGWVAYLKENLSFFICYMYLTNSSRRDSSFWMSTFQILAKSLGHVSGNGVIFILSPWRHQLRDCDMLSLSPEITFISSCLITLHYTSANASKHLLTVTGPLGNS